MSPELNKTALVTVLGGISIQDGNKRMRTHEKC